MQDAGQTQGQQPFSSGTLSEQENLCPKWDACSEAPPIISRLESLGAHACLGAGLQTGGDGTSRQTPADSGPAHSQPLPQHPRPREVHRGLYSRTASPAGVFSFLAFSAHSFCKTASAHSLIMPPLDPRSLQPTSQAPERKIKSRP